MDSEDISLGQSLKLFPINYNLNKKNKKPAKWIKWFTLPLYPLRRGDDKIQEA